MESVTKRLVISLITAVCLILISIPLWSFSQASKGAEIAESFDNIGINVNVGEFKYISIMDDDDAMKYLDSTPVSLRNQNSYAKNYEFVFKVSKDSTIDYKFVKIAVNNNVYSLTDLEYEENNEYYYFKLINDKLDGYTTKEYDVRLWLDTSIDVKDSSINLVGDFTAI